MTTDRATVVPKRRALDMGTRLAVGSFSFDSHLSVSLPAIVVGLAGAAAIVYVSTLHKRSVPPGATEPEAIETTGVSLVK